MAQRVLDEVVLPPEVRILYNGVVERRTITRLVDPDTGEQVGPDRYHRRAINPEEDIDGEHPEVQALVTAGRTPERVALWETDRRRRQARERDRVGRQPPARGQEQEERR